LKLCCVIEWRVCFHLLGSALLHYHFHLMTYFLISKTFIVMGVQV
jgi:hypothetical protein